MTIPNLYTRLWLTHTKLCQTSMLKSLVVNLYKCFFYYLHVGTFLVLVTCAHFMSLCFLDESKYTSHTDRYLDYNSHHPISAKLSVIHTLFQRAKQLCSTPEFLAKEIDHLHKVLQDNHYPAQFFQQGKPPTESQSHPQKIL